MYTFVLIYFSKNHTRKFHEDQTCLYSYFYFSRLVSVSWWRSHSWTVVFHILHRGQRGTRHCPYWLRVNSRPFCSTCHIMLTHLTQRPPPPPSKPRLRIPPCSSLAKHLVPPPPPVHARLWYPLTRCPSGYNWCHGLPPPLAAVNLHCPPASNGIPPMLVCPPANLPDKVPRRPIYCSVQIWRW